MAEPAAPQPELLLKEGVALGDSRAEEILARLGVVAIPGPPA